MFVFKRVFVVPCICYSAIRDVVFFISVALPQMCPLASFNCPLHCCCCGRRSLAHISHLVLIHGHPGASFWLSQLPYADHHYRRSAHALHGLDVIWLWRTTHLACWRPYDVWRHRAISVWWRRTPFVSGNHLIHKLLSTIQTQMIWWSLNWLPITGYLCIPWTGYTNHMDVFYAPCYTYIKQPVSDCKQTTWN